MGIDGWEPDVAWLRGDASRGGSATDGRGQALEWNAGGFMSDE
jgi:hypothetical protein